MGLTAPPDIAPDGPPRRHRARLEIDLGAVADNWRALDAIGPAQTGAAIKADGYGLGVGQIAPTLFAAGCRTFFTATEDEAAAALTALGPEATVAVFVLNGFGPQEAPDDLRVGPVLNSLDDARQWRKRAPTAPREAHPRRRKTLKWRAGARPAALQVETGMRRLGIDGLDQGDAIAALVGALAEGPLRPTLVMSHLAAADAPGHPLNQRQKHRFDALTPALRRAFPTARLSLAATGGALLGPEFAYDLVRPGIGLYGGLPFAQARPVARLRAPILQLTEAPTGACSGYGATWTARRPSLLATLALGYADGLPRALGGKGRARVHGTVVPIAGRVSMDLLVLDVTDVRPTPQLGDWAWLLDDTLTVDRLAADSGTIGYEILTGLRAQLGSRAERLYLGAGSNGMAGR